jgi:alkanesulfonate monooxygenase SsuD/methylene tetrahydromethanopterin reductase-like flavin-dependent oxidoreductase (luciferase family)
MKLGISLSTKNGDAMAGATYVDGMRTVEDVGFDSLWFFDAIGRGYLNMDPLGGICAAAAATSRIELGTCIVQAPLRHPVELAQRALTAHLLSEGRFRFGLGAGSTEGDFNAVGVNFADRFKLLKASLATMQALWNGETVDGVNLTPWKAAVGGPPILIGSWAGSRWIPIAAEQFDGWIGSAMYTNAAALKAGVSKFKDLGGKRAIVTNIQVDLTAPSKPLAEGDKLDLCCGPEEAAVRLQLLADCGYDDAILVVQDHSKANLVALRSLI